MIKFKKLSFKNIGRFIEEQTIDFDSLEYLSQIDGKNLNTGGSSGAGKSTIFKAVDFLFGLNDIPNSILQSRYTKDPIQVAGLIEVNGEEILVTRGKKLSIEKRNATIAGSNMLAEEELDKILSIPRPIFRKLLHKRQKEGGFFLKFTPKQMNDFLIDCLDLGSLRDKIEVIDKEIAKLSSEKESTHNAILIRKSYLDSQQAAIISLGLCPVQSVSRETLLELKQKIVINKSEIEQLQEKFKSVKVSLEKERPILQQTVYNNSTKESLIKIQNELLASIESQKRSDIENKNKLLNNIKELEKEIQLLNFTIQTSKEAHISANQIAIEIKKLRSSVCPTCDQSWSTDLAKNRETALLSNLDIFKKKIHEGTLAQKSLEEKTITLEEIKQKYVSFIPSEFSAHQSKLLDVNKLLELENEKEKEFNIGQMVKNQSELNSFIEKERSLTTNINTEMARAETFLANLNMEFSIKTQEYKLNEDAINRYNNTFSILKNNEKEALLNIEDLEKTFNDITEKLLVATESKRAIKSYLSRTFDDALDFIGEKATQIVRSVPNMANATIQLESIKETKEGKIKEEVNAVISVDGEIGIPIKSLSGGEDSSVDLAVDMAVLSMIETMTNKGINLFLLDEPFTGLDAISIEMALEVLKNSQTNKKIVIVDHAEEIKSLVGNKIVVTRNGQYSSINQ